nr:MAG TPA: hypothetical protein [Caudoviricetes sp.]
MAIISSVVSGANVHGIRWLLIFHGMRICGIQPDSHFA